MSRTRVPERADAWIDDEGRTLRVDRERSKFATFFRNEGGVLIRLREHRRLPLRRSFEEAQQDLDAYAEARGCTGVIIPGPDAQQE